MAESPPTLPLQELVELAVAPTPPAAFYIAPRQQENRWQVQLLPTPYPSISQRGGWWAVLHEMCGDAPHKYHPKYLMAVLSAGTLLDGESLLATLLSQLLEWPVPAIDFTTEEFVRRSMSLNGMRMSLEYFESGSLRVIQLVEQRLDAGQRDVVHDVLVYLMQQIVDIGAKAQEARLLRAESLAAYLGLQQERVNHLLLSSRLASRRIAEQIQNGYAGPVRRAIDVPALVQSQLAHLRPTLQQYKREENQVLWLLDEIVGLLRQNR
ncbi:MAG: hypothetical protein JO316_23225 [Abitibacteriaceae bacterium]|nr:hypothetical protein [Abditibacteriaceae bacterium]